jgi:hypothetical protein
MPYFTGQISQFIKRSGGASNLAKIFGYAESTDCPIKGTIPFVADFRGFKHVDPLAQSISSRADQAAVACASGSYAAGGNADCMCIGD